MTVEEGVSVRERLCPRAVDVRGVGGGTEWAEVADVLRSRPHWLHLEKSMGISLRARQPLLVMIYCGGKCGSSTLLEIFRSMGVPSVRIHNMDHFVDEYAPFLKSHEYKQVRSSLHPDTLVGCLLHCFERIYLVDAYRDPVERRLSSFFQNYKVNLRRAGIRVDDWERLGMSDRVRMLEDRILPLLENRHGLDTAYPAFLRGEFDFIRRFQRMPHPRPEWRHRVVLCKVRFEDIHDWASLLGRCFHERVDPPFPATTPHQNRGAEKAYAEEYQETRHHFMFRHAAPLWQWVLDPVFCKYHTPQEFSRYIHRWIVRKE